MFARLTSGTVLGIEARLVEVQVDIAPGLPMFSVVGLPEKEISESRERIRSAIKNAGFAFPSGRITANLAPADLRKGGVGFDLPIALALLVASEQMPTVPEGSIAVGELGLDGEVRAVQGVLPVALEAASCQAGRLLVPAGNAPEAGVVEGIDVYPIASLEEAVEHLRGNRAIPPHRTNVQALMKRERSSIRTDLGEVRGQIQAKRAIEIAAAGGHNLVLSGPPGAGKSLLAKCVPDLLPALSFGEALEVTRIYSIAGLLEREESLRLRRPFRAPHHTISYAGMVGGGRGVPGPGEISLAHHGVLFLDELPEFERRVLETLRQPLEEREIHLTRAGISVRYPAAFTLIAAMNPCPCGYLGDPIQSCECSLQDLRRYRRRLSGPFLDRIDLFVEVPRLPTEELFGRAHAEGTAQVRERILGARARQWERLADLEVCHANAQLDGRRLQEHCVLAEDATSLLRRAVSRFGLSARGHVRVLRVARTIADLAQADRILPEHVAEALQFRGGGILSPE